VWRQLVGIYTYREMLLNLVAKELRARYKGSVLGFLWTFLYPLLLLMVYSVVFSYVVRIQVEHYVMFLFVALLPWNYMAQSITLGTASLVQNGNLIKKVYFPRVILPISVVLAGMANYLLSLIILLAALLASGFRLTPALLAFPVLLGLQTLLIAAITPVFAVCNVYFRDLEHITGVFVLMWFFLSPVLYPSEMVPPRMLPFFSVNPATPLMEGYRRIFYHGTWPEWGELAWLALGTAALFVVCWVVFGYLERAVAERV